MTLKLDKYHRDYLFWIYPLIILITIIFAIKRDNNNRTFNGLTDDKFNADSSITMSINIGMADSLKHQTGYSEENALHHIK